MNSTLVNDSSRQRKLGVVLGYVNTAAQTVVSFLYTPLLLVGIGQAEYGLYQIIGSLTAYINIFESMLTTSALRFYCQAKADGDQEQMETILAVSRLLYGSFACVVAMLSIVFAFVFQNAYRLTLTDGEIREGLAMLVVVTLNIIINMMFYTYSVVVQANERFAFIKILELVGLVLQPVLVLALISGWPQAIAISFVQLFISATSCLIKRFYAVGKLKCIIKRHGQVWGLMKAMLAFSLTMFISMVADIVFAKTGQLLIGAVMSSVAVAIYSVGYQVYQAYATLGRMVSSVFVPHVTDLSKLDNSTEEFSLLWRKTGRVSAYIVVSILLIFGLYGDEFIGLWVGNGYGDAYVVALLMMIAFIPDIVQALGLTILQVINRYAFRSIVYVLSAVANIILSIPFIAAFGVCGSAVASLIVLFVGSGFIMNFYYYRQIGLDVPGFWKDVLLSQKALPLLLFLGLIIKQIVIPISAINFLIHCALLFFAIVLISFFISMNESEKRMVKSVALRFLPAKKNF